MQHIITIFEDLAKDFAGNQDALYRIDQILLELAPQLRAGRTSEDLLLKYEFEISEFEAGRIPKPRKEVCFALSVDNSLTQLEILSQNWDKQQLIEAIAYLNSKLPLDTEKIKSRIEIKRRGDKEYKYLRWVENGVKKSKYLGVNC